MKRSYILLVIFLLITLFWPSTAYAKEAFDDKVVFGGTYTLESGETHAGSLVVFGGAVTIEPDSTVNGDVVLIGGTVDVGGHVNGSVVGIGGAVRLEEEAYINGDLFTLGAALRRDDGARVNGQVVNGIDVPSTITIPDVIEEGDIKPPTPPKPLKVVGSFNPFLDFVWFFFRIIIFSAVAVLVVMFLPVHVDRVKQAALTQPVITTGAGLLTAILGPLALVVITITIILIPVTIVAVVLFFIAWLIGWVALGSEVGKRIAKAINIDLAPAISAGVGTFILLFVFDGFRELIPCIGWIPQTLVGLWGLGAVLLTRFGTQDYSSIDNTINPDPPAGLGEVDGNVEIVDAVNVDSDPMDSENDSPANNQPEETDTSEE